MRVRSFSFPAMLLAVALLAGVVLAAVGLYRIWQPKRGEIHIALVGPMSGPQATVGRTMRRSIGFYLEEINREGGINGLRAVLDIYDDQNKPDLARKAARAIAADGRAVAVIGHRYSDCSLAGGEVYGKAGIPAITPMSTNVRITKDNPWYFRALFDDSFQGQFLAKYAVDILGKKTVSIIYAEDGYSRNLARSFEETARYMGTEVKYQ